MPRRALLLLVVLLLAAAPASARFASLDRTEVEDFKAEVDLDFTAYIGDGDSDLFGLASDFYLQGAIGNIGGYLFLPVSSAHGDGVDETALGAVELGALGLWELPSVDLIGRLGVALPTAGSDGPNQFVHLMSLYPRLGDLVTAFTDTTSLRLAFSAVHNGRYVFLRGDIGLDLAFSDSSALRQDFWAYLRVNLGLGLQLGPLAFTVESVNTALLNKERRGGETVWNAMSFALHLDIEALRVHFGVVVPLDEDVSDDLLGFSTGLALRL